VHLFLVGLNHRTAPIELRERLSFTEPALQDALAQMRRRPGIAEAAILSTCNRTEVYAVSPDPHSTKALIRFLSDYHRVPEEQFASHVYSHNGEGAVMHLFRVVSGLDSLVLGEPQILGQVREAFTAAAEHGAAGPVLSGLFRAAIAAGRRARTETDIGKGGFSVGHAAVDLARSIFGSLDGRTVLILGAGKMSELTAKHLVASGLKIVLVANRTYEKAAAIADRLGGRAIRYDDFPEAMTTADVVISSTASPTHVLTRDMVSPVMRRRRGRPLFIIDIAVPRDVAPDVASVDNLFLYDVDDLEEVVTDMARERAGEVGRVETLLLEEAGKFAAWWRQLDVAPVVAMLKTKQEEIRRAELARLRNQLPDLSDYAWRCIENAMTSTLNKITRDTVVRVKEAATGEPAQYNLAEAAKELFALEEDRKPEADPDGEVLPNGKGSPPLHLTPVDEAAPTKESTR
jgi:glutamyl-tRNA reductase